MSYSYLLPSVCNKPTKASCHVSFILSWWIIYRRTWRAGRYRDPGVDQFVRTLWHRCDGCFFACQIPPQRKKAPAKQARRCQLSSCQGNERETWRRGQTPTYSKRSAMLFVRQSKHTHFPFVLRWHLLTSPHNTHSSYYTVTIRPFNFTGKALTSKWMMTSAGTLDFSALFTQSYERILAKSISDVLIPLFVDLKERISRSKWNASGDSIFFLIYDKLVCHCVLDCSDLPSNLKQGYSKRQQKNSSQSDETIPSDNYVPPRLHTVGAKLWRWLSVLWLCLQGASQPDREAAEG